MYAACVYPTQSEIEPSPCVWCAVLNNTRHPRPKRFPSSVETSVIDPHMVTGTIGTTPQTQSTYEKRHRAVEPCAGCI